jgi:truncated hemoglobin YjbI
MNTEGDGAALTTGEAERLLRRVHTALAEAETQRRTGSELLAYAHRMLVWVVVAVSISIVTDVVDLAVSLARP